MPFESKNCFACSLKFALKSILQQIVLWVGCEKMVLQLMHWIRTTDLWSWKATPLPTVPCHYPTHKLTNYNFSVPMTIFWTQIIVNECSRKISNDLIQPWTSRIQSNHSAISLITPTFSIPMSIFWTQIIENECSINIANDWIGTMDLWGSKWLCTLCNGISLIVLNFSVPMSMFWTQIMLNECSINITNDLIRTMDLWGSKWPLYQLCHFPHKGIFIEK